MRSSFPNFDATEWAYRRNAVLGIPDSGKTVTAKKIGELMMAAGIPITALDPAGNWRFLRVPGGGRGFPVVVVGGAEPDIVLPHPDRAAEIMRAVMSSGVSVVFDLYNPHLSKADWRKIVASVAHVLCYENKPHGLRHLFVEEAAEFVPQVVRGDVAVVYGEIERIVRMARNASVGVTLINQRAEELNKAVLELCDNLFLHRQKGRRSLQNLSKWLDIASIDSDDEIISSLPTLPQGECWAWTAGSDKPAHVKVPMIESYHPAVTETSGKSQKREPVNVSEFVAKLNEALPRIEAETKANDPAALKAEVRRLTAELAKAKAATADTAALDQAYQDGQRMGWVRGWRLAQDHMRPLLDQVQAALAAVSHEATKDAESPASSPMPVRRDNKARIRAMAGEPVNILAAAADGTPRTFNGSDYLPAGQRIVLTAIAQTAGEVSREQITVITGYKKSTRDLYLQKLAARRYIEPTERGQVIATAAGVRALGAFSRLPEGAALREYWLERLPAGERAVLESVVADHPQACHRDAVAERSGYKKSTRDLYIQKLAARKLITVERGFVRASDELFDRG